MSNTNGIAEVEQLLLAGRLEPAAQALRNLRWAAPRALPLLLLDNLLQLLRGDAERALAGFARLAAAGDGECVAWDTTARLLAGRHAGQFDAGAFLNQLGVERLRRSPYLDYPLEVHLETMATCNAACTFCPYPRLERRGTRMDDALIDKVLGDLEAIPRDLPFGLAPFKVNEPLLDRRIYALCAAINTRLPNARLRLFTNGSPLSDENIARIATIGALQHLWISLNEHDADAYQRTMGLPLARTLQRLDRLHAAVVSGDFPHPVIVSRVRSRSDADDAFVAFVSERYPRFSLSLLPHAGWAGQIEGGENRPAPPSACARWFELSIMADGKVALCCMDGEGRHVIGDVREESALAIYNHPDYRRLRERTPTRLDAGAPCSTCDL